MANDNMPMRPWDKYDIANQEGYFHGSRGFTPKPRKEYTKGEHEMYSAGHSAGKEHQSHHWGDGKGNPHGDVK